MMEEMGTNSTKDVEAAENSLEGNGKQTVEETVEFFVLPFRAFFCHKIMILILRRRTRKMAVKCA